MQIIDQPSEALRRIIARAAPPHERAGEYFVAAPEPNEARRQERQAAWARALGGDDPAQLDALLAAAGLRYGARALDEAALADPARLPLWGETLAQLFAAHGEPADAPDLFGPFAALGRQELRALDPHGALLAEQAAAQAIDLLRRRILTVTSQVLYYELAAMGIGPGAARDSIATYLRLGGTRADWLRRLELYPALAYVVAVVYRNWYDSIAELLARLADDRQLLAERLLAGQLPGPVVDLQGDAGDLHNHGRSVVLLTFASGGRAVYKPKDLRIAAAYMDLVARLNPGLELPLPTRAIVTRPGYAWEECVAPGACTSHAQIERFYTRMGMTIRLLQLLEARDFWLDNLLACGEQPVFVDLEMLLQPRMPYPAQQSPAQREAWRQLEESPAHLGVLSMPMVIAPGVRAEDLGALSASARFLTPFKHYGTAPGAAAQPGDFRNWEHAEHIPQLGETPMPAASYLGQILAGYRAMHACLLANQPALLADDGPLQQMQHFPVRFIHRDTWTNYKIVQGSVSPSRLRDGVRREQFLVQLLRGMGEQARPRGEELAVLRHEIADIRECDVPFFLATPADCGVRGVDGDTVAGYFDEAAFARLRRRVAALERFDLDGQCRLLASCFAFGHRPAARQADAQTAPELYRSEQADRASGRSNLRDLPAPAGNRPPRWLDLAVELGDAILEQGIGADDERAWLGLSYYPLTDVQAVEVLQPDLYAGVCGLAVLFADLYAATGLARFRSAAHSALATTLQYADGSPAQQLHQQAFGGGAHLPCGGLFGAGAQLYTLARCGRALNLPALGRRAQARLLELPLAELCRLASHDLACGAPGLLLAALACLDTPAQPQHAERALFLADQLLRARRADGTLPPAPYPPGATALNGIPDGTAGLALALARLGRHTRLAPELCDAAGQIATLVAEPGDLARAPGRLLARLGMLQAGVADRAATADADAYLAGQATDQTTGGLLGQAEVALAALAATHDARYHLASQAIGRALWLRRQAHGTWFPETFAADCHNLGAINGIAAVAHLFIRLDNPAAAGSLRLLA